MVEKIVHGRKRLFETAKIRKEFMKIFISFVFDLEDI